jgi:hypothetical protein
MPQASSSEPKLQCKTASHAAKASLAEIGRFLAARYWTDLGQIRQLFT